jgi:transposase
MSESITLSKPPRRHLSARQKLEIVEESYEPGAHVSIIARKHNVGVSSLIKWRKLARTGSLMSVKSQESLVPESEVKKLKKQIRQLERMLGKKTIQNEILKEAVEIAREKKLISRQPLPGIDDIPND